MPLGPARAVLGRMNTQALQGILQGITSLTQFDGAHVSSGNPGAHLSLNWANQQVEHCHSIHFSPAGGAFFPQRPRGQLSRGGAHHGQEQLVPPSDQMNRAPKYFQHPSERS